MVGPLGYVGSPGFLPKHGGGVVQVDRVVLGSMDREAWRFSGVERVDGFLVLAINTEAGLSRWAGLAWVCRTVWVEGLSEACGWMGRGVCGLLGLLGTVISLSRYFQTKCYSALDSPFLN